MVGKWLVDLTICAYRVLMDVVCLCCCISIYNSAVLVLWVADVVVCVCLFNVGGRPEITM